MLSLVIVAAIGGFIAGFVAAVAGFGFALFSIPLLALTTATRTAVVGVTLLSSFLTFAVGVSERRHVNWRTVLPVTIAGVVGMPVGLIILGLASERTLKVTLAVIVLISVPVLAGGLQLKSTTASSLTAGGVSGAMLTSTGMNGPPLVVAFHAMKLPPRTMRATLLVTFCLQDVIAVVGFAVIGRVSSDALLVAAAGVPFALLGWFVGDHTFQRIPARVFRYVILGLMVAEGCVTLFQAIGN